MTNLRIPLSLPRNGLVEANSGAYILIPRNARVLAEQEHGGSV